MPENFFFFSPFSCLSFNISVLLFSSVPRGRLAKADPFFFFGPSLFLLLSAYSNLTTTLLWSVNYLISGRRISNPFTCPTISCYSKNRLSSLENKSCAVIGKKEKSNSSCSTISDLSIKFNRILSCMETIRVILLFHLLTTVGKAVWVYIYIYKNIPKPQF